MTDEQKIWHLYSRFGFGCTPKQWQAVRKLTLNAAIDKLFKDADRDPLPLQTPKQFDDRLAELVEARKEMKANGKESTDDLAGVKPEDRRAVIEEALNLTREVANAWLEQMSGDESAMLREKMTLFWHGHFACEIRVPNFAVQQINRFRNGALGSFGDLVKGIARDAAMIRYLNNQQNVKNHPNENFAREVLELFTIGRGHYTETDVKEAARAFTGWVAGFDGEFRLARRRHDFDAKTFMGQTGDWDGDDILSIVLTRPEVATFITRKIYRFFVSDTDTSDAAQARIADLAKTFFASGLNVGQLMRRIAQSEWFYDAEYMNNRIKSPIELLVGLKRVFKLQPDDSRTYLQLERALGQVLFHPPNVAGWAGGKSWIDNSTLLVRMNLVPLVFMQSDLEMQFKEVPEAKAMAKLGKMQVKLDPSAFIETFAHVPDTALYDELCRYLFGKVIEMKAATVYKFVPVGTPPAEQLTTLAMRLMTLPEYQLG